MHKAEQLEEIRQAIINLTDSPLYEFRVENAYHPVIGEGSPDAALMFIGEAPGQSEARQGRPFVGASGRVLDELLAGVGLKREDVYITNIVKDRPPNNRDPRKGEIKLYAPFLDQQIEIIQPKVIATLGRFSMEFVLDRFDVPEKTEKISKLHGQRIMAQATYGEVTLLPLYHPAVTLYNTGQKATLVEDFEILREFID